MLVGHTLKERYRVYDRLGVGGAATVYLARDSETGQMVIVKVVHSNLIDKEFIGRFQREIDLLKQIDNPYVIQLYDWGLSEFDTKIGQELSYIVAEYVEGHTLADIIDTRGPLTEHDALAITRQLGLALQDIHEQGIIHRDVKSQNIMITPDNKAKLIDFGIAKSQDQITLTASSFFAGTIYYAAPEQILATRDVDHRADIYSLGVVLYEMINGNLPVRAREFGTAASRIIAGRIEPLNNASPPVETLAMNMLATKPEDRIATAADIVRDIESIIGSEQEPHLPDMPSPKTTLSMRKIDPELVTQAPRFLIRLPSGQIMPITQAETIIGRSHPRDAAAPDIDLWALGVENARTASRRHCRIMKEGDAYYLEDLGSMNGTRLNEEQVEPGEIYALSSGDQIMAGKVRCIFETITDQDPPDSTEVL